MQTISGRPRVYLAANFLSGSGGNRSMMEELAQRLGPLGYPLVTGSPHRNGPLRGAHLVAKALGRRREYDLAVVDLFSGRAFLWGETLSRVLSALRCPFVLVLRGGGLPDLAKANPQRVKACLARAAVVITPSAYLHHQMRPYRSDLRLIPNPIEIGAYPFQLRGQPGPNLVWLRAFHQIYNPSLAPRVVKLLAQDVPDVHLTMFGPDQGDGSLQETQKVAADLGVADRISFPGPVKKSNVPEALQSGDIFINTTNVDNTPISVQEALACGLCVVSTSVGGVPYLLDSERDSLLVLPADPAAMADAIRRILQEPGLGERLSRAGRAKVEQFDWSAVLPQWEAVLNGIAGGRRPSPPERT